MNLNTLTRRLAASLICLLAGSAFAQGTYPTKPITLILPNAPGASSDVYARIYSEKLREAFKQPLILDFRAGGGGTVGANFASRAAPDGYTLALFSSNFATSSVANKSLPYDPIESFAPISLTSTDAYLFVSGPALPVSGIQEYLAYAKANPGKVNFGAAGAGSFTHLMAALLNFNTDTKVTYIQYKGGQQTIADLVAGRIHVSIHTIQLARPFIDSGKVKAIGIASAERNPTMPQVRTVAEQGVPGYDVQQWRGFVAPAKTPAAIVTRLNREFAAVARSAEMAPILEKMGRRPVGSTPEQFKSFLVRELGQWKKLLTEGDLDLGTED